MPKCLILKSNEKFKSRVEFTGIFPQDMKTPFYAPDGLATTSYILLWLKPGKHLDCKVSLAFSAHTPPHPFKWQSSEQRSRQATSSWCVLHVQSHINSNPCLVSLKRLHLSLSSLLKQVPHLTQSFLDTMQALCVQEVRDAAFCSFINVLVSVIKVYNQKQLKAKSLSWLVVLEKESFLVEKAW